MSTTKKRINITADVDIEAALLRAAKRDQVPVASKAAELLRLALEIEEDSYFATLASKRLSEKVKYIRHDRAWR